MSVKSLLQKTSATGSRYIGGMVFRKKARGGGSSGDSGPAPPRRQRAGRTAGRRPPGRSGRCRTGRRPGVAVHSPAATAARDSHSLSLNRASRWRKVRRSSPSEKAPEQIFRDTAQAARQGSSPSSSAMFQAMVPALAMCRAVLQTASSPELRRVSSADCRVKSRFIPVHIPFGDWFPRPGKAVGGGPFHGLKVIIA